MKAAVPFGWVVQEPGGPQVSFRWGYDDGDVVAEWEGLLRLRASRDGQLKTLEAFPGVSPVWVEKMRHGMANAFLRAQRKQHSLHASAVAIEGHGLVCVGPSGLGKSTMAARLCGHPGIELLADDIAAIEVTAGRRPQVLPTESAVWLGASPAADKARTAVSRVAGAAVTARLVACLAFNDGCQLLALRDLSSSDAISALLPSLIRFEKTAEQWERELDFLERLVPNCRVVQVTRSRDVQPETVADALRELMAREVP
jgi:hypothetical protein